MRLIDILGAGTAAVMAASAAPAQPQPAADPAAQPTLYVVGYSHLDTQWRWTYIDTIREYIPATLRDNFRLFERYPSYVFNFSGSRRYRMMQEYYPADFEALKRHVAAGRWFPCGSSVDENDANVPSAESLVRHVLYGNRFFRREFGVASDEYMLPDCFGFPAALPSVLAHCGISGFSTQKLTWGLAIPQIPFKVGVWEGPDGRGVVAALDPGAYVGEVQENLATSNGWQQRIANNGKQSGVYADYHYYGTGDQGGAPSERSVQMVEQSVATPGPIKVVSGAADLMFKAITPAMRERLPRYKGELMLTEHSAGSLSSQATMKRWNRKNELLADAAERAAVAAALVSAAPYPARRLEDAWYLVLGSQMHDILPGTSLPRAYDLSWNDEAIAANQFGAALEDAAAAVIGRMDTRGPTPTMSTKSAGSCVVVYNPLSIEREDVVEAELPLPDGLVPQGVRVTGPDGSAVPAQVLRLDDGWTFYTPYSTTTHAARAHVAFLAKVPPVGWAAFSIDLLTTPEDKAATALRVSERELENERYLVKLDARGDVSSIFDKQAKREMLSAPARIGLHHENPRAWPAWNQDWADRQKPPTGFAGAEGPVTFKVVETGPARVAVEVTRQAEGSTFVQRIRLSGGGAGGRVEFDTRIDWRTRERSVRAAFPLVASNPIATYDIQAGAIERPNSHEKHFEYSFHKWINLTDAKGGYGVSLFCDSKYASDKPDDRTLRLTLLHTPGTRGGYPDQGSQDLGRHRVLYAIAGHEGDWRGARSYAQADRLNQPLIPFRAPPHDGRLGRSFSLLQVADPAVSVSAAKLAEDGSGEIIVRLREQTGKPAGGVRVAALRPIVSAREVDGQERELRPATVKNGGLVADVGAYELRAFALRLAPDPAQSPPPPSASVNLPFDTDAVTTNANRRDGAMDDQGRSLPAEQFPASIEDGGLLFKLGSTSDGAKNALTCRGQEITLPAGDFDRLSILAAADGDARTTLQIDGVTRPFDVQEWTGMIGSWDQRAWPAERSRAGGEHFRDITGLRPGFVRSGRVAWFCSHHHTTTGDAIYEYAYLFRYDFDLPPGAKTVRLPDDPRVKVFAITAARVGGASAVAAAPLFDTLADHVQDAPRLVPDGGTFTDWTQVRIEPGLYWWDGAIRYTTDGSNPTLDSTPYARGVPLGASATIKAAVITRDGTVGPVTEATFKVDDITPPSVARVSPQYGVNLVNVTFSEPIDDTSVFAENFSIEPPIPVVFARHSEKSPSVVLKLASPLKPDQPYRLSISGVRDASPAYNPIQPTTVEMKLRGPVYHLADAKDQMGRDVRDAAGLPVKAGDAWTLNMFVRTDKQPPNRTLIAGFGTCDAKSAGTARYLAKFGGGVQFWSHNRDAEGRTPLELGRWQMLTAAYDGRVLRLYKDAKKIGEREVQLADDESVVRIAPLDPWEGKRRFEGEVRELTIWDAALDEETLATIMASAAPDP